MSGQSFSLYSQSWAVTEFGLLSVIFLFFSGQALPLQREKAKVARIAGKKVFQ
jgi:hypothetical protein